MSLEQRIRDLSTRVGQAVKALTTRVTTLEGGATKLKLSSAALPTGEEGQVVRSLNGELREFVGGGWRLMDSADSWIYGDGADGDIVLDGTTSFATFSSRSGSVYTLTRDVYFRKLTVNPTVTLKSGNFTIYCLELVGSGNISNDGNPSTGLAAGTPTSAGTFAANQAPTSGVVNAVSATTATISVSYGGRGAAGGNGGFTPGTTGANTLPTAARGGIQGIKKLLNMLELRLWGTGVRMALGVSGTGGTSPTGGNPTGGGVAGGYLLVVARECSFNGILSAKGGNTANATLGTATAAGAGGPGGGGLIVVVTREAALGARVGTNQTHTQTLTTPSGVVCTLDISGGTGGSSVGTATQPGLATPGNLSLIQSAR